MRINFSPELKEKNNLIAEQKKLERTKEDKETAINRIKRDIVSVAEDALKAIRRIDDFAAGEVVIKSTKGLKLLIDTASAISVDFTADRIITDFDAISNIALINENISFDKLSPYQKNEFNDQIKRVATALDNLSVELKKTASLFDKIDKKDYSRIFTSFQRLSKKVNEVTDQFDQLRANLRDS